MAQAGQSGVKPVFQHKVFRLDLILEEGLKFPDLKKKVGPRFPPVNVELLIMVLGVIFADGKTDGGPNQLEAAATRVRPAVEPVGGIVAVRALAADIYGVLAQKLREAQRSGALQAVERRVELIKGGANDVRLEIKEVHARHIGVGVRRDALGFQRARVFLSDFAV